MSRNKIEDYQGEDPELTSLDFHHALDSQSAPNLLAITSAFVEVLRRIRQAGQRRHQGAEWAHQHPICVLYATQIAHLTRGATLHDESGGITYQEADRYCTHRAFRGSGSTEASSAEAEPSHS